MEVSGDTVLSVDDLLARSAKAAASKSGSKNQSAVQKLLAGREDPEDTVDLSPVARLVKQSEAQRAKTSTPFTEQDWYLKAKVSQLKAQIEIYSNLPGLDPSGAIMDSLSKEVRELVAKQQAKLKKSSDEAAAKKKQLDELNAEKDRFKNLPTPDQLLKRSRTLAEGGTVDPFKVQTDEDKAKEAAVKKLLEASAKKVDTTA